MEIKRVEKPWGHELWWAQTNQYVGKLLHVKAGHKLSLQYHVKKDETIHLQTGELLLVVDEGQGLVEKRLLPGESYHIRPGTRHRMVAVTDCDILEVSTPEVDDIVRLEDAYGRTNEAVGQASPRRPVT
jgi:mannose-6-phosphate isomerase